jgi:hypothetical protein
MKKKNRDVEFVRGLSLFDILGRISWILVAFLAWCLLTASFVQAIDLQKVQQKQEKRLEVEADGYTYVYEAVPALVQESRKEIFYNGKITVKDGKKDLIYQEIMPFSPGMCSGFPPLSKLPIKLPGYKMVSGDPEKVIWLVVLCGSITGRHQTMKIFLSTSVSLRSTFLHFEDTSPNLSDIDGDGLYEAVVFHRVLFDDVGYGVVHYLTIYKLNIDSTIFGFCPQYDSRIAGKYFDYFLQLKRSLNREIISDYVGPMLAALLATKDRNRICGEIKTFRANGLTIKDLQTWEKRLKGLGYPSFDFNLCKEGLK